MDLEGEMKVLEKRALDVEASNKLNKEEVEWLEATLATAERERNAEKEERIGVE